MKEILPGIRHWMAAHPKIKIKVSSYWLPETGGGTVLDPILPEEGLDPFRETPPAQIILTNRHHWRDAGKLVDAFGCTVRCHREGLHEFSDGRKVEPMSPGDRLPGGIEVLEVGSICPDDAALHIPLGGGAIAFADGLIRDRDGLLGFVPDEFMGDDPERVKEGLRAAFRRILEREFDHLLLAHGRPWIGGGKEALREFAATD